MPSLSGLQCNVELSPRNIALPELDIAYGNRCVSCTVGVPDHPVIFNIHFSARNVVGHGLAVFVFIDGQYQANRNWTGMSISSTPTTYPSLNIDFRFRQKEELAGDGRSIIARDWHFRDIKTTSNDDFPHIDPNLVQNLGTIEVVVLRCASVGLCDSHGATDIGVYGVDNYSSVDGADGISSTASLRDLHKNPDLDPRHSQWFQSARLAQYGISAESEMQMYSPPDDDRRSIKSATPAHYIHIPGPMGSLRKHLPSVHDTSSTYKPYWSTWNAGGRGYGGFNDHQHSAQLHGLKDPHIEREYEQPLIHKAFVDLKSLSVQATTGKGALYTCSRVCPGYYDCMESPFAVFTFSYRRRQALSSGGVAEPVAKSRASKSAMRTSQRQGASGIGARNELGKSQSIAHQDRKVATKEDQQPRRATSRNGSRSAQAPDPWPKVEDLAEALKEAIDPFSQDKMMADSAWNKESNDRNKSSNTEMRGASKAGSRRSNNSQGDGPRSNGQEGDRDNAVQAADGWGVNNAQGWDDRSRNTARSAANTAPKSQARASNASNKGGNGSVAW